MTETSRRLREITLNAATDTDKRVKRTPASMATPMSDSCCHWLVYKVQVPGPGVAMAT